MVTVSQSYEGYTEYTLEDQELESPAVLAHHVRCKIKNYIVPLDNVTFEDCDFTGTCLDPNNKPKRKGHTFKRYYKKSGYLIGYRTTRTVYMSAANYYEVGETYRAEVFSTSNLECHPGLYVCPTPEDIGLITKGIVVIFKKEHLHKAGSKYRVKEFTVIGIFKKEGITTHVEITTSS